MNLRRRCAGGTRAAPAIQDDGAQAVVAAGGDGFGPRWSLIPALWRARPAIACAATFAFVLCWTLCAFAFDFPALSGRVVDQANIMSPVTKSDVEKKSKDLEDKSGIQLVVATVKSLQGSDIETYANQLFRFWKLGEAKNNNGVLLLVAPTEHKVRIEVGYGLEGTLTDALSSVIITSAITPRFKANDFSGGIERGVDGIIAVLTTGASEWHQKAKVRADDPTAAFGALLPALLLVVAIFFIWYLIHNANGPPGKGGRSVFIPYGGSWGSGGWGGGGGGGFSGGGGFDGGGFSGGGGSSGGGGASGSW